MLELLGQALFLLHRIIYRGRWVGSVCCSLRGWVMFCPGSPRVPDSPPACHAAAARPSTQAGRGLQGRSLLGKGGPGEAGCRPARLLRDQEVAEEALGGSGVACALSCLPGAGTGCTSAWGSEKPKDTARSRGCWRAELDEPSLTRRPLCWAGAQGWTRPSFERRLRKAVSGRPAATSMRGSQRLWVSWGGHWGH